MRVHRLSSLGIAFTILVLCLAPSLLGHTLTIASPTEIGQFTSAPSLDTRAVTTASTFTFSSSAAAVGPQAFPVSISYSPANPAVGYAVTFNATVSGALSPYAFLWTFGDGTNGTSNPIAHTYILS